MFVLLQKPEGEQLCSPWSQQQEQCDRVDHREWPPLPLSVGNQGNHAIMSQGTGVSCRHRHASGAAHLCEISQSQPAGSAGFQWPSPGQALHTSRPCFYHRGWEVSNIELHFPESCICDLLSWSTPQSVNNREGYNSQIFLIIPTAIKHLGPFILSRT